MNILDGRKLDHATLEELRIRAVQRVEAGESPEVVIASLGMSRPRIYEWLAAYRAGGIDALRAKPVPGRPRKLTEAQLGKVYRIITSKNPLQLRFPFALWTRGMVCELIREKFDVELSESSVGRMLRKMGLSPQKPLRRAYQQDPEAVAHWKQHEFPKIQRRAKQRGASIFFADEARVQSDYHSGRTWAPIGQTPTVESTGARFGVNLISAVSPRGELRFMGVDGLLNADKFIEFLKRLTRDSDQPVFLVLDGHPVHRSAKVRRFAASTDGMLELYFLPSYASELNPTENVWSQLKHHTIGKRVVRGPDELRSAVLCTLRRIQKLPRLVMSFFLAPDTRYAASPL